MMRFYYFKSIDKFVQDNFGTRQLDVVYNDEEGVVTFRAKCAANFTRNEAIRLLKDVLKSLEENE